MTVAVAATYTPDKLIAGQEIPLMVHPVTLKAGQGVLKRGSAIGIETATDEGILCDKDAADGSQVMKYVLIEDTDTTSAVVTSCYGSGIFNRKALIFGSNGAPAKLDEDLRPLNIFLKDEISK